MTRFIRWSILTLFAGCAPAPLASHPASPSDRQAIVDANARIVAAVKKGDAAAIAAEFAPDATMLPAGMPAVSGHDAIQKVFAALSTMGITDATITTQEVVVSGDLAVEVGVNSITITKDGAAPITAPGKYLVVWKRQSDGGWKIQRDMTNQSQ
ncbi:MAG TPA: SgcJ/EcaC family oxidoreductase [Kofleriaceae bacterium]|nr:SgcJ/EcaC family oxidoreductase [Kofleriaceae bacterium]